MTILIFFVLGLIIGSFLNVVIFRLDSAESLLGRSQCRHCRTQIAWYDNIPFFSFLLLRGRCRGCEKKISWQYPAMEIGTGLMFALVGQIYFAAGVASSWVMTGYFLGIVSALLVIFVYDLKFMEIPGSVLWPAIGWAVAFNLFFDWEKAGLSSNVLSSMTFSGTLGAFAGFLFFFLLVAVSKEKWMGLGDAQLAILLGLILGWPKILLALMLSFASGAIIGLVLIALQKKKMQSQIPFAPFLIAGALIALVWYAPIMDWYFTLF